MSSLYIAVTGLVPCLITWMEKLKSIWQPKLSPCKELDILIIRVNAIICIIVDYYYFCYYQFCIKPQEVISVLYIIAIDEMNPSIQSILCYTLYNK